MSRKRTRAAKTPPTAEGQAPRGSSGNRTLVRSAVLALAVVAAGALWWFAVGRPEPGQTATPAGGPLNVLLITADTLGADQLGVYGNRVVATPRLDALAASGVLFENATTVAPLTLPAHISIMTGTYPMAHHVRDNGSHYVQGDQAPLATMVKLAGYATGAFVG